MKYTGHALVTRNRVHGSWKSLVDTYVSDDAMFVLSQS